MRAASAKSVDSSVLKPLDVTIDMAVDVFDAGHGSGGIRRAPRMSGVSCCKDINRRKGDSSEGTGKLQTGET